MSNKTILLVILLAGALILLAIPRKSVQNGPKNTFTDIKYGSYEIDGKKFQLINGRYEAVLASDSSSRTIIQYFGNEASGDINNDGISDKVFLLTKNNGGSGTFYYAVAALGGQNGYIGTNAVLLGDRIAPQTTEIRDMISIVNYADRKPDEPMTAKPSVGVSKYFRLINGNLEEIELKEK